jgi:hypothetical protein
MGPFLERLNEIQATLPQLLMDFFVAVVLFHKIDVHKIELATRGV